MAEVSGDPIQLRPTAGKTDFNPGYLVKKNSGANNIEVATTVNDTIIGVLDQGNIDGEQALTATVSGRDVGVHTMGCGKNVVMRSVASVTYVIGQAVYNAQTASTDGLVDNDSTNSATKVGHYVGVGETTSATDGDEIKVCLDVANIDS